MTQAEKTMLRYQYVLAQTTSAHGDYARTIRSWHNQIILLKENFKELGIIVGTGLIQAIKPFVMAMNAAFSAVLTFSTNVLNALGQIFGWEVETFARGSSLEDFADTLDDVSGGIGDTASGADDTASGLEKADKAAKKLKATVLGFDELNILNGADEDLDTASGSGSGAGSGTGGLGAGGGLGDGGFGDIEYKLKKTDSKFKSAIDNLYDLGKYISDSLAKVLDDINWNKIYKKAENFGKGLAEFLNGLVQPHTFESLGRTVGNSINTAMKALDSFAYTFNFHNLGSSIALGVRTALESINWNWVRNAAVSWGYGLGAYLNGLIDKDMFAAIGDSIAKALNAVIVGAIAFTDVFEGSNVGTALATGINHAIEGINWEDALTAAKGIGDDVSSAINNFIQKTHWDSVGSTLANALNTGLTTFFSITDNLDWEGIGTAIGTAINSFLEDFDSEDFVDGVNGIIDGLLTAIDALKETGAWDNCVKKIGEVIGGLDWVGLTKLYLADAKLNFVTSIATDIANGLAGNPVKAILSSGVGLMGNALSTALALKIAGVGGGGAAAGSVAGAAGVATGTVGSTIASTLLSWAPVIGAAAFLIYGYIAGQDPAIQKKIEDGKVALDKFRNDETKNWSLSYQNMSGTASDYSKQIENTVKTTNNGIKSSYDSTTSKAQTDVETANAEIKRSYDSLGREIGYSVNGDYGRAMDDMQSIGERAAEGIKNAFQSVTDFFSGLDFPTWHLEWEQHEEGGYGFSLPKIVRYASGGFPDAGLFFANEYGNPEMIGTIGRRPAVANNDQITTAIRGAVVDGMMQVFMATGGMGGNGGSPTVEVTVKADSETLYRTVRRGEQKYNRRYSVVAQM